MEAIPELTSLVQINKENVTLSYNKLDSPTRSIRSKKSLSILSANEVSNRSNELSKPIRQRVISESTGLVKFSLKASKASPNTPTPDTSDQSELLSPINQEEQQHQRKSGLPFYIPVDSPVKQSFSDQLMSPFLSPHHKQAEGVDTMNQEEEMLFKYAKKQRQVLELKARLEQSERELKELELMMTKKNNSPEETQNEVQLNKLLNLASPMKDLRKKIQETTTKTETKSPIKDVLRSKVSMLNFSNNVMNSATEPTQKTLNRQLSMLKIKQDINEISNNLITDSKKFQNDFLAKSKNFISNFQSFSQNAAADFSLHNNNTLKNISEDTSFHFGEKDNESSDDNELTYSSDQSSIIEDLEGGSVVPYEIL